MEAGYFSLSISGLVLSKGVRYEDIYDSTLSPLLLTFLASPSHFGLIKLGLILSTTRTYHEMERQQKGCIFQVVEIF